MKKPIASKNNLLTTVAWKIGDKVNYALEGSIFVGGSVVQWLRDGLRIIRSSSEVEELAASVPDTNGVYFVPALTGLAAPHWDQYARGAISGISRGRRQRTSPVRHWKESPTRRSTSWAPCNAMPASRCWN